MASWNSENLRVWKVWLNGIQKIEELNSIIFKAWKVWLYGIQKIEEFNSMVFTTWKLWFYGIKKIEEFKSMVFKAWRGQNLLMRTLFWRQFSFLCPILGVPFGAKHLSSLHQAKWKISHNFCSSAICCCFSPY